MLNDENKNLPFIDRIVQFVIDDDTTQWMMFLSGKLDSSNISRDNWDVVINPEALLTKDLKDKGIKLSSSNTNNFLFRIQLG